MTPPPQPPRRRRSTSAASVTRDNGVPVDLNRWRSALDVDGIIAAGNHVAEVSGIAVPMPIDAVAVLASAGLQQHTGRWTFPNRIVAKLAQLRPTAFKHSARDDALRLTIEPNAGAPHVGPAFAADWLWSGTGRQRLRRADVRDAAAVCRRLGGLAYCGSALALELADQTIAERLLTWITSDAGPLLARLDGSIPAAALIAAARTAVPLRTTSGPECRLLGAIVIDHAFTLSKVQGQALAAMAEAREAVLVAPTLLLGANAPASVEGALVRFAAELQSVTTILQALAPGVPVVAGIRVAEASMRTGMPVVGTAACLRTLAGACAVAHRLGFATAALGPATGGKGLDAQAASETTLWLAATSAFDLVLGGIGGVDLDTGLSLEKLILDVDTTRSLVTREPATPSGALSALVEDMVARGPGAEHLASVPTREVARVRRSQLPRLADDWLYESWVAAGQPLAGERAQVILAELLMAEDGSAAAASVADIRMSGVATLVSEIEAVAAGLNMQPACSSAAERPRDLSELGADAYNRAMREAFGFKGA